MAYLEDQDGTGQSDTPRDGSASDPVIYDAVPVPPALSRLPIPIIKKGRYTLRHERTAVAFFSGQAKSIGAAMRMGGYTPASARNPEANGITLPFLEQVYKAVAARSPSRAPSLSELDVLARKTVAEKLQDPLVADSIRVGAALQQQRVSREFASDADAADTPSEHEGEQARRRHLRACLRLTARFLRRAEQNGVQVELGRLEALRETLDGRLPYRRTTVRVRARAVFT